MQNGPSLPLGFCVGTSQTFLSVSSASPLPWGCTSHHCLSLTCWDSLRVPPLSFLFPHSLGYFQSEPLALATFYMLTLVRWLSRAPGSVLSSSPGVHAPSGHPSLLDSPRVPNRVQSTRFLSSPFQPFSPAFVILVTEVPTAHSVAKAII